MCSKFGRSGAVDVVEQKYLSVGVGAGWGGCGRLLVFFRFRKGLLKGEQYLRLSYVLPVWYLHFSSRDVIFGPDATNQLSL